MLAQDTTTSLIIGLMVLFYLVLCARTAWSMRQSGRSFVLWLAISIFTTSIPATMVLIRDQRRGYNPAMLAQQRQEQEDEPDEGDHHLHRRRADKRSDR